MCSNLLDAQNYSGRHSKAGLRIFKMLFIFSMYTELLNMPSKNHFSLFLDF